MLRLRLAAAALLGIAPAAALAASPPPVAADAAQWAPFDVRVARANAAMMADPDRTLAEASAASRFAVTQPGSLHREISIATARWLQGEALLRLNRPEQADPLLREALGRAVRYQPGKKLNASLLQSAGSAAATLGRVQEALRDFQGAYRIFHALDDARGQAMALTYISMIYLDAGDYGSVLRYQAQAADIYSGDAAFAVSSHNNLGFALRKLNRFRDAEAEYKRAFVSARKLRSPVLEARILANTASAQQLGGRLAEADATADRGLEVAAGATAADWRPFLWTVKAQVAAQRGQLALAKEYIGRTFAGADLAHTPIQYRDSHEFAHRLYARLGDDRLALAHLEAFKRLDDDARAVAANANAALMAARFDFANQDLRITKLKTGQLERDVLIARSRARLHQLLMAAVIAAFALLLFLYFSIRRSRNEVRVANTNLSGANVQLEKALKAKTEFLATTSHEIRTPLNGILGMTQVILHDPGLDGPLRERIQVVHGAGETMKALVDDLLDVAKMETGNLAVHPVEMSLRPALEDIARLWSGQARGKGIALELGLADCPGRIVEDDTRLRQILFNLLSNAIKFTERGAVRLSVAAEPAETGELLRIRVRDSGIGIPDDQLARIFEPFHQVDGGTTRRYGGTGLGLAICRNVARTMGGDVTVESRLGEGSTFVLTLPLTRVAPPAATARGGADGERPLAERRLLLIERNPLAQSIVRATLENEVAALAIVESGDEALATLADGGFDDVVGEGASIGVAGHDRFQSVRAIAAAAPGAAVTLLWADLSDPDRAALHACGAARVLAKPIAAKALLEALKAAVADAAAPPEARKSAA